MAEIVPVAAGMKRLTIKLSDAEHKALIELALRCRTSPAVLGRYAVNEMFRKARWGRKPRIKPARLEDAVLTTVLGEELHDHIIEEQLFGPREGREETR